MNFVCCGKISELLFIYLIDFFFLIRSSEIVMLKIIVTTYNTAQFLYKPLWELSTHRNPYMFLTAYLVQKYTLDRSPGKYQC